LSDVIVAGARASAQLSVVQFFPTIVPVRSFFMLGFTGAG